MKKGMRIFCSFVILLVLLINLAVPAGAAANGIYIATATPYYVHPVTGVIEDSGQNPGIGQGMTESVLNSQALIEVDANGKTYATVRYALMDNIQNVSFSVQKDGHSEFKSVSYSIMKEDLGNNKTDFRIQIPSENAIVRSTFYVIAMHRDVVFYFNFSNLAVGSGDFVTSITVNPETQPQTQPQTQVQTQPQTETATQETQAVSAQQETTASEDILEGVQGLAVYKNAEDKKVKKNDSGLPIVIVIVVAVAAAVTGGVLFKKKRRRNKEELTDENKKED
jgi:cobalamin biosynthesis Mg chelatase CobN